jgi:restriction system protein
MSHLQAQMIPDYQSLMLPLLRLAEDGREHRIRDVIEPLGKELGLTQSDLDEMLPSGRQPIFNNRVHWAKTYLAQAKLLEITRRAHFRITERGREVLRENPAKVDVRLLERFPEFNEFKQRARNSQSSDLFPSPVGSTSKAETVERLATPDELLRATITDIEAALSSELLDRILSAPPVFFEELIVALLLRMGYGGAREEAGRAIGKSGDGGIDGVIDQDPLGLDRVYLQAKRYKLDAPVSEPEIRAFSGSLGAAKASKGVFVTTSYFTGPAYEVAERHPFKMVLIDGKQLAVLMIRHNVGVRTAETLHVKKLDEDFFTDEE